jgi:hypothetical protein
VEGAKLMRYIAKVVQGSLVGFVARGRLAHSGDTAFACGYDYKIRVEVLGDP